MNNRYHISSNLLKESYSVWWWQIYQKSFLLMAAVFVVMLVLYLTADGEKAYYLFGLLLPPMFCIFMPYHRMRALKQTAKRFDQTYQHQEPFVSYDFYEEEFTQTIGEKVSRIPYQNVEKVIETKDAWVLILYGKMFCMLKKNGFSGFDSTDICSFLQAKNKKVKIKRRKRQ